MVGVLRLKYKPLKLIYKIFNFVQNLGKLSWPTFESFQKYRKLVSVFLHIFQ